MALSLWRTAAIAGISGNVLFSAVRGRINGWEGCGKRSDGRKRRHRLAYHWQQHGKKHEQRKSVKDGGHRKKRQHRRKMGGKPPADNISDGGDGSGSGARIAPAIFGRKN